MRGKKIKFEKNSFTNMMILYRPSWATTLHEQCEITSKEKIMSRVHSGLIVTKQFPQNMEHKR